MKLFLYNVIDSNTSKGILKDLAKSSDSSELTLHINSPGGSVLEGYAIYNQLRQSGKNITVNIDGMAGSIASVIAMAADTINISEAGRMMIHNPTAGIKGDAEMLASAAETLKDFEGDLIKIYSKRTGQTPGTIRKMMNAETILKAKEAVSLGFADNIVNEIKAVALFENNDMSLFDKLKEVLTSTEGEKVAEEVKAEIEEKVSEEVSEKKNSEDPAELLMQEYVNITDYSEFKNEASSFMDVMIEYVKAAPTQDEINAKIEEVTNKKILDFIGKIKSEGKVPNKTETEATFVKEQSGNKYWNAIEEGLKDIKN